MSKSEITIKVELDENKVPQNIKWQASEFQQKEEATRAFFLSLWDAEKQETLRIDLWTKDMELDDMKKHFHQTLHSMADTLERATGEDKLAADMRDFSQYFGEKIGILEKQN